MAQLTGSQMKYLHVIYKATKSKSGIRSVDVARELEITKASVSRMVKLLAGMRFIDVKQSGYIELTPKGKAEGNAIHRRITAVHAFFSDYLGLSEPEATDSAYCFVSQFSEHCVDQLLVKGWVPEQTGA